MNRFWFGSSINPSNRPTITRAQAGTDLLSGFTVSLALVPEAVAFAFVAGLAPLAGLMRMPFWTFLALWAVNVVPYCALAAYAGSLSTLDDPRPAILAAIGLSASFWAAWAIFNRRQKRAAKAPPSA